MNKFELADKIAEKTGVSKKKAEDMLNAFTEIATAEMSNGGEVVLTGFGTFSAIVRKSRKGINPQQKGISIQIPPIKTAKFKPGKTLKDTLKASSPR